MKKNCVIFVLFFLFRKMHLCEHCQVPGVCVAEWDEGGNQKTVCGVKGKEKKSRTDVECRCSRRR